VKGTLIASLLVATSASCLADPGRFQDFRDYFLGGTPNAVASPTSTTTASPM